jgi:hypothetical protein
MTDNDQRFYVSRREFYGALLGVWLYIVISMIGRQDAWVGNLLWAGAVGASLLYMFLCITTPPARPGPDKAEK